MGRMWFTVALPPALMAERIFLITAIVFGIVVPIAVMVALVYN